MPLCSSELKSWSVHNKVAVNERFTSPSASAPFFTNDVAPGRLAFDAYRLCTQAQVDTLIDWNESNYIFGLSGRLQLSIAAFL